jgi:probable DNA repair protein
VALAAIRTWLQQGGTVITVNQRLARGTRQALLEDGSSVTVTAAAMPCVLSLDTWLDSLWRDQQYLGRQPLLQVLDAVQELALWRDIAATSSVMQPVKLAQTLREVHRLLCLWQQDWRASPLNSRLLAEEGGAELCGWLTHFEALCAAQAQITRAARDQLLARQAPEELALPALLMHGFDQCAPVHRRLCEAAPSCEWLAISAPPAPCVSVMASDAEEELQAALAWAAQRVAAQPGARVAVVVPDLAARRPQALRAAQAVFDPDALLLSESRRLPPVNISGGEALEDTPPWRDALALLALGADELPLCTAQQLLESPHWLVGGLSVERRAELATALAELELDPLPGSAWRETVATLAGEQPVFVPLSSALAEAASAHRSARQTPRAGRAWVQWLLSYCNTLGWPGERPLDSIEYQQLEQGYTVLRELQGWRSGDATQSHAGFCADLRLALGQQLFQPQTADTPVQVLGVLEAAGLDFSHVWLCSAADQQWPPAPEPNPLLPRSLQRELGMPRADAQRELDYARRLSQRLRAGRACLVVSHLRDIEGVSCRPSRLFDDATPQPLAELVAVDSLAWQRYRQAPHEPLQGFEAGPAPAVAAGEISRGGAALLASQSACPFQAYARHRLQAASLPEPVFMLSAADRGNLLHWALEWLWGKLRSQEHLLAVTAAQRAALISESADHALGRLLPRRPVLAATQLRRLEQTRLVRLLDQWLELECQRPPFTVEATEWRAEFRFDELSLRGRMDRIDRLADGTRLIIDYKSGEPSARRWFGERPEEPQLPLYAGLLAAKGHPVAGIAYAQINARGCKLIGVGDDSDAERHGLKPAAGYQADSGQADWAGLQRWWQARLETLAAEYLAGRAHVDPSRPPATCQYCEQAAACRYNVETTEDEA